jgi:hypothetical protein
MTENERFGLVFPKTGSINSGTALERIFEIHVRGNDLKKVFYQNFLIKLLKLYHQIELKYFEGNSKCK